jgi:Bacterial DNA polymerase III alpha NTPase domain
MNRDRYGRRLVSESEVCDLLYADPAVDLSRLELESPDAHNAAIKKNYSELGIIRSLEDISLTPTDWHHANQSHWWMPDAYRDMDIAKFILDRCDNEAELQRCGMELLEYQERGLMPLLRYLKYLVDTLKSNGVIWGVGRGSSVASFVLYKLGVHRIDSLHYDLDFKEFMR